MRAAEHAPRDPSRVLERRTPAVERLQRAGARAVGALTFGHACRSPGEQCADAPPDAIDFLLRSTFDALPIDVASPESFRRRFPQHWCAN